MQYDPYKHKAKTVRELSYPWGYNVPFDTELLNRLNKKSEDVTKCKPTST